VQSIVVVAPTPADRIGFLEYTDMQPERLHGCGSGETCRATTDHGHDILSSVVTSARHDAMIELAAERTEVRRRDDSPKLRPW